MPDTTGNYWQEERLIHPLKAEVFFRQHTGLLFSGLSSPSSRREDSAPVVVATGWFGECHLNLLTCACQFQVPLLLKRAYPCLSSETSHGRWGVMGSSPLTRQFKESMTHCLIIRPQEEESGSSPALWSLPVNYTIKPTSHREMYFLAKSLRQTQRQ